MSPLTRFLNGRASAHAPLHIPHCTNTSEDEFLKSEVLLLRLENNIKDDKLVAVTQSLHEKEQEVIDLRANMSVVNTSIHRLKRNIATNTELERENNKKQKVIDDLLLKICNYDQRLKEQSAIIAQQHQLLQKQTSQDVDLNARVIPFLMNSVSILRPSVTNITAIYQKGGYQQQEHQQRLQYSKLLESTKAHLSSNTTTTNNSACSKTSTKKSTSQALSSVESTSKKASKYAHISMADRWMNRYNELIEYKKEHGSTLVPQRYKKNPKLGKWVTHQRSSCLTEERKALLDEIGFVWDATRKGPLPVSILKS
ncbi:unnamed protein product [Pseudo-nitzschia multistriata]|uniref:Helicase-associated domain-containing protein n=1 Tax=Pseudo-nitzschia multistriata TaxID=183589 RepID=A0A448ZIS6_9STRA|nr:unnamed protein product [Pseudo-nitzschia multistriata]